MSEHTAGRAAADEGGGSLLDHALGYARAGLAVLPLAPRGKVPVTEHGKGDATTDPQVIERWWQRDPLRNIGICPQPGVAVLDVDPRNGGSLEALGMLPETWTARTGGGGWHVWFRCAGAVRGRLVDADGVDIKTHSGYVVAPPSVHPSRDRYRWLNRAPIAMLPEHLRERVRVPAAVRPAGRVSARSASSGAGLVRAVAEAQPGQRNSVLFWAASCAWREGGDAAVLDALTDAGVAVGLSLLEIERTLASAERRTL
ncbi:bifunctional DNA primase/polymerase [Nocardia terpenica]|uniref:bifunctional DNA primase/polymerase n=1 Tax=Nocardia terpenica TaxID=455432 RepID=UPI0012FDBF6E|nr:bifunctional DNA primase/polymerase [Nocardia terpenica]